MFPPMEPPQQPTPEIDLGDGGADPMGDPLSALDTLPIEEPVDEEPVDEEQEPEQIWESDEAKLLLQLTQDYYIMEENARNQQLKKWKKCINYWNSIQYGAWDEMAGDWKTPQDILDEDPQSDIDPTMYAKVINVYKAHGEILIGALTSGLPTVRFFPKDADDHDDIAAAKARSKIADMIQRQNKARLLFMKTLFLMYNCGLVACYNENKTDFRFGSYKTPDYDDIPVVNRQSYCPTCGMDMGQEQFPAEQVPPIQPQECPNCGPTLPEYEDQPDTVNAQVGETTHPKNRECLEVFGPLNVRIPLSVKEQVVTPYIVLEDEFPIALIREIYPELADRINAYGYSDNFEEQTRIPLSYAGDFPRDNVNVQRIWYRPWALNLWNKDADQVDRMKKKYPEGVYCVILNRSLVAEIVPDDMDKRWTFAENPFAETLHPEPIGAPMIPLQDMENELDNLTLETIEFGIGEVFADPKVVDFEEYRRQESRPGQMTPANPPAGRSLGEGFYQMSAASLSREVDLFAERMNGRQQFVQGTYPSIYGGAQDGGSGTAREYELSKASALQRLSTTWVILQEWWAKVLPKAVQSYVENMKTDEQYVKSKGSNFVSVWIRKSELQGEVGDTEAEIAEPFPVSWAQKRDVILNLIQMQNEDIMMVVRHPENAGVIATIIGVPELYIPGDDDRNKQLAEIAQLIVAEPIMQGMSPGMPPLPMGGEGLPPGAQPPAPPGPQPQPGMPPGTMPPPMQSSIQVDPDLDNHIIEAEICRAWLKSEVGMDAKQTNPGGYMNVLQHMKEHLAMASIQQMQTSQEGVPPEETAPAGPTDEGLAVQGEGA